MTLPELRKHSLYPFGLMAGLTIFMGIAAWVSWGQAGAAFVGFGGGIALALLAQVGSGLLVTCLAAIWSVALTLFGLELAAFALLCSLGPLILASESLRQLRHSRAELERLKALHVDGRGRLFHDLRTPLNGISGAFELLERRELDQRQKRYVALGVGSTKDMISLLEQAEFEGYYAAASQETDTKSRFAVFDKKDQQSTEQVA